MRSTPEPQPPPYYPQQDFPDIQQHNNNGDPKYPQIPQHYISSVPPPVQRYNSSTQPSPIESQTQQYYPSPQSSTQLPYIPQEEYFDEKL
uniref:Uncharacterized protein n=1 Tax=Panagrolaimus davidi TaxID=227884 RepID=A0A914P5W3_9BILA